MNENPVQVDGDELAAEAERIELPPGAAPGPDPEAAPGVEAPAPELVDQGASWASSAPMLLFLIERVVCPNWKLTDTEKADLAGALVPVLDDLFPGGLGSEKWAPYFRLVAVAGAIVVARIEPDGSLKPLRAPPIDGEAHQVDDDARPAGPFTTSAGAGSH